MPEKVYRFVKRNVEHHKRLFYAETIRHRRHGVDAARSRSRLGSRKRDRLGEDSSKDGLHLVAFVVGFLTHELVATIGAHRQPDHADVPVVERPSLPSPLVTAPPETRPRQELKRR